MTDARCCNCGSWSMEVISDAGTKRIIFVCRQCGTKDIFENIYHNTPISTLLAKKDR